MFLVHVARAFLPARSRFRRWTKERLWVAQRFSAAINDPKQLRFSA